MSRSVQLGRVVEVDARDATLARWLAEQGEPRYLGLAAPDRLADLRAELPAWAAKFQPWLGPGQVRGNDAQTLALAGDAARALATRASFSHVERLLVPAHWTLAAPLAVRRLLGNLRFDGELALSGGARWRICPVRRDSTIRPRMYLSPELGPRAFFARLNASGARYAVLRWWDELPDLAPGRDIDFLVHDEDLERFEEALGELPGTLPLDVYTSGGVPGHDYRGACYYPPARAAEILERAVDSGRGVRVPAAREAFFSLAFHAVYHKGEAAGLACSLPGVHPSASPKHDFAAILAALARPLGLAPPLSLEGLDDFLAEHGWRPPRDTLRKWSRRNAYVGARHFARHDRRDRPGPAAFVLRESALELGLVAEVEREVARRGFEVLARIELDAEARARLAASTRGGNWFRGEFGREAGGPAVLLVACDPRPTPLRRRYRRRYPDMDNGKLTEKRAIRDEVNARLAPAQRSNFLHASDNAEEAWEYVRCAAPERETELRNAASSIARR